MEELRSTDVLDKEIAADARKKVARILQRADDNGKALLDAVPEKVKSARMEMEAGLKKRVAAFKKNSDASMPLEKERFHVSFVQAAISSAMEAFIKSCSEDELLSFVTERYKKNQEALKDKSFYATFVGLNEETAKRALKEIGAKIESSKRVDAVNPLDTGVILEGENVKARITVAQIVSEMEDDKRAELSSALLKNETAGAA